MPNEIIRENFNQVYTIIELHRSRALQEVNNNSLFIAWNVGAYVSAKIKSSEWGSSVVTELSEYLRTKDPTLKGYSRRNIYMMVKFYETYSAPSFVQMLNQFKLNEPYLLPENIEKDENQIVQFEIAQFPRILLLINWTCHQQILNGCKLNEERIFYIIYAQREHFEVKELQRAIKTNAYESILGNRSFRSQMLKNVYPASSLLFKDIAYLDFLGLPAKKYHESKLRKGIIQHMKEFILELGKDFIFMDEEHKIEVGGKTFSVDLLFYHRGLRCLVAIELKTVEFDPNFMGKLEFYLEALDQTEKRSNENPSIGILLCKEANRDVVKYALNRTMSPTMVAEYKEKLIPQETLQRSLEQFIGIIENNKNR
ncbi:DUF1016 family protein [bacterium]|nr:DUF1016 family protein [bacterium]